jgi:hypothetical protein
MEALMKSLRNYFSLLAVLFSVGGLAKTHEVSQSLSLTNFGGGSSGASLDSGNGSTVFAMGGSYYKVVHEHIQLGANLNFMAGSGNAFTLLAGARYNFGSKAWTDDFFVNPSVGFAKANGQDLEFVFDVGFGKRFLLLENVAYVPSLSFYYLNDLRFRIDFVRFSVVF